MEYGEFVDLNRLGGVVTKGVANVPWPGNPTPRVTEVYGGMLNAIGLQNPGIDVFIERDLAFLKDYDTNVIVNVCGKSVSDYLDVVERLNDTDIDMMEINISCPNVKEGAIAFGQKAESVYDITKQIKDISKKPVIMKLSPIYGISLIIIGIVAVIAMLYDFRKAVIAFAPIQFILLMFEFPGMPVSPFEIISVLIIGFFFFRTNSSDWKRLLKYPFIIGVFLTIVSIVGTNYFVAPHWPTSILRFISGYVYPIVLWSRIEDKEDFQFLLKVMILFAFVMSCYILAEVTLGNNPFISYLISNNLCRLYSGCASKSHFAGLAWRQIH